MTKPFVLPGYEILPVPNPEFNITHTKLEMRLDFVNETIEGRVTHEISPARSIDFVELDAAELNFKNVIVDGVKSKFEVGPKKIKVLLGRAVAPPEHISLIINYEAKPRIGLHFRKPNSLQPGRYAHAYTTGLLLEDPMYYFPCYNYPNMRMTTETSITIPSHMIAVGSGKLTSVSDGGQGERTWHFRMDSTHVTDLLNIVAGEYLKLEERFGEIPLEYYVPPGCEAEARRAFHKTPKMIQFFSKFTGVDYPYPKYAQVVVSDFFNGGMEHVTATTLTDEMLHDARAELDFQSDDLVSHELAHQWLGDLISLRDWSQAWINEGFATYFNALFREYDLGSDDFQYYMHSFLEQLKEEISKRYQRPIVTQLYSDSHEMFDMHTYLKGAWVLHGIRGILGDKLFGEAIKRYVAENKGKISETSNFRKSIEFVSKRNFGSFFNEWLEKPGYPIYKVRFSWEDTQKKATVNIEQTNALKDDVPLFSNPIEIRFSLESEKATKIIQMDEPSKTFEFILPSEPLNVSVDPSNWILKDISYEKPLKMYLCQLSNDENVVERIRACEEIATHKRDEYVKSLSEVIDSRSYWGLKVAAAKALGKIGTDASFAELGSRVMSEDPKVRRAVAEGLAGFEGSRNEDAALNFLVRFLESDESFQVRASAARSLSSYKESSKTIDALRRATTQDSYFDVVRVSVFKGLAEVKDTESLPNIIGYFKKAGKHQGRIAAAHAMAQLSMGDISISNELLSARNFPDARVRLEAASAIGESGIVNAESLYEWLKVEPEGRVRRRIRETIYSSQNKS